MSCTITKFVERDIDMLLAEELATNPEMTRWLLGKVQQADQVEHPAIRVNVSDHADGSEADVLADFKRHDETIHRVLIEDKIDAALMPEQLERYVRRGEGDCRMGRCRSFSAFLIAPAAYLLPAVDGVLKVTFEELAEFLALDGSPRLLWKAGLLLAARPIPSQNARSEQVKSADPYIAAWWDAVYAAVEERYPGYFVHRTLYPRSTYFAPSRIGQPSYLRVDFKGHKGEVDLAFKGLSVGDLVQTLDQIGTAPGRVVENGKSAAIRLGGLAPVVISDGFEVIGDRMMALYDAAHCLLEFHKANAARFDRLMKEKTNVQKDPDRQSR